MSVILEKIDFAERGKIFYQENQTSLMDTIDYGSVYMPSMEDNEGGVSFEIDPNLNSNSNSDSQTHIPVVDGFNQQMM